MNDRKFRKLLGRWVALSLVFCLLIGLAGCGSSGASGDSRDSDSSSEQDSGSRDDREHDETQEEPEQQVVTGTTPEETLEIFFKAMSEQDVETMMACCYIEDYVDRVSFAQYVDRNKQYHPLANISAPTDYDYYRELVLCERRANFAQMIEYLTFSLLAADEEYQDVLSYGIKADLQWAVKFSHDVNPKALANLKVLRIDIDRPDIQNDSAVKENWNKVLCADSGAERTVLLELDGQLFYKGFTLAEIDGHWQIYVLSAMILGKETASGTATPVESEQAYLDIIQ